MKKVLFTISLSLCLVYFLTFFLSIFLPFYKYEFRTRGIYDNFEKINVGKDEVNRQIEEVISYMHGLRRDLDPEFFSSEDVIHMGDVRSLFLFFDVLFIIFLVVLIYFAIGKRVNEFARIFLSSGVLSISFALIVSIFALFSFDESFIGFHRIFFRNDYWLLDSETSSLIKFFPLGFFRDFVFIVIGSAFIFSLFLIYFGILIKRKDNNFSRL